MSSMGGHFVFFLPAPKQLHAALLSWRTTPAAIAGNHVAEKTWKLTPSWKTTPAAFRNWFCNAKEVPVCGSYWCICRRWWVGFSTFPVYSKPTESFVTYFPKERNNPHLFYSYGRFPRGTHSVAVKQFKRERRFRLLGHIPHTLVDDGALFPLLLSEKKTTSVH